MAATLLSAFFCAGVAHPQRRVGFALYVPVRLWDGVDLFTDPYRWDGWWDIFDLFTDPYR